MDGSSEARLHEASSPTHALQDSRSRLVAELDAFDELADEFPGATRGILVALGDCPVVLEVLAGPRSFAGAARKLLSGYAFEALGAKEFGGIPDISAVKQFVRTGACCTPRPSRGRVRTLDRGSGSRQSMPN